MRSIKGKSMRLVDCPYFAYRGGKATLRRYIVRFIPLSGSVYVEPFVGRANVFFVVKSFADFHKWVLNDLQTIPFLSAILKYDGQSLPTLSKEEVMEMPDHSPLLLLMEPILFWAGGIKGKSGATGSRGHKLDDYKNRLLRAKQLLAESEMRIQDANEVIEEFHDDPQAFLYLDPPYLNCTVGSYSDSMLNRHKMIDLLKTCKCRWLMSEYYCTDLVQAFGDPFTRIKGVPVNPNPKSKGPIRREEECLWANYNAVPSLLDFEDFFDKPMKLSIQVLKELGKMTFSQWESSCPKHWASKTIEAQFNRLCYLPFAYWDGETLYCLSPKKELPIMMYLK